jgi:hypothetical protein
VGLTGACAVVGLTDAPTPPALADGVVAAGLAAGAVVVGLAVGGGAAFEARLRSARFRKGNHFKDLRPFVLGPGVSGVRTERDPPR